MSQGLEVHQTNALVLLERAWALLERADYASARAILLEILPFLSGERLGVAYKRLALAQFYLGLEWQALFERAIHELSGRLLGLAYIDYAGCAQKAGNLQQSKELLVKALPKLRSDQYYLAWTRYNLGELAILGLDTDAERHFVQAEKLTRRTEAKPFRSRALQGVGKWRRYNGDFIRAEEAYRLAIKEAVEDADLRAAYWSLGRTLRLQGRLGEALELLEHALQIQVSAEIQVEVAAVHLAMGRSTEFVPIQNEPYRSIALILQAQAARLHKNGIEALDFLQKIDYSSFHVREELGFWTDLSLFASLAGYNVPTSPPRLQKNTVEVRACGVLQVLVNNIEIQLKPTGRVGELLVLLLERGGGVGIEKLIEALYPQEQNPKSKKNAVLDLVKRLRLALGWKSSILVRGNVIQLEPSTHWIYDASLVRQQKIPRPFLEGVYSEWVLEVATELNTLDLDLCSHHLN
ncbi:MAG: hypothetical protein ACK41E_07780 [Deinococcales bacterium]